MHDGDVVVTADDIAEGREALFDTLDLDTVWEGIAEVLEFLIGCCCRDEETVFVSLCEVSFLTLWRLDLLLERLFFGS